MTHYDDELSGIVTIPLYGGDTTTVHAFTQVTDNLWIAGVPRHMSPLPRLFDHVVNVSGTAYRECHQLATSTVVAMDDADDQPMHFVDPLAAFVDAVTAAGQNTLVHCQAGLNRSPLVAARVLIRRGMTAGEAVATLRERRSLRVLTNQHFTRWLHETPIPAFGPVGHGARP